MRTVSHALIGTSLGVKAGLSRTHVVALAIGSSIPDLPLFVLTAVTMLGSSSWDEGMALMHENYAYNPLWIALHNTPHSLIVLAVLALLFGLLYRFRWAAIILWGLLGATLHTVIDIFTHATDGPYFLYPLSASIRFESPVSYWDPSYFGRSFTVFEIILDALLVVYLVIAFVRSSSD